MKRLTVAWIAVCGLAASAVMVAQQSGGGAPQELDTVLVIGEQPGPGLWKVSSGSNVMWVLGTYSPLPKEMTWRSREVEGRIRESRLVLLPGSVEVDADIGVLRMITLVPSILKAAKLPDDQKLPDVLSAHTYQNWSRLRQRYVGGDDADKYRPGFALSLLIYSAYRRHKLDEEPDTEKLVQRMARKADVKVRRLPDVERTVRAKKDVDKLIKGMRELGVPEVDCFSRNILLVEPDIRAQLLRANAWARGNVEALRALHQSDLPDLECDDVMEAAIEEGDGAAARESKRVNEDWRWHEEQARVQLEQEWLAAARSALQQNDSTFAVLPMREVLHPEGYLAKLRAMGYIIEEPQ